MTAALATLVLGAVVGYLGQRSRLCFTAGFRDLYLMRNAELLTGVMGVFVGAAVGYTAVKLLGGTVPSFPLFATRVPSFGPATAAIAIASGLAIGFVAVLAGGCPFRMHVLAGEGRTSARRYLAGFYAGIVFFDLFTSHLAELLAALVR